MNLQFNRWKGQGPIGEQSQTQEGGKSWTKLQLSWEKMLGEEVVVNNKKGKGWREGGWKKGWGVGEGEG